MLPASIDDAGVQMIARFTLVLVMVLFVAFTTVAEDCGVECTPGCPQNCL